mmetsp:Transcript_27207/g.44794  ORF Transcript_27207/g.44794 Transcript_27207/m.44794 type:complete len:201 (+) Transcript_27207:392-994(+)
MEFGHLHVQGLTGFLEFDLGVAEVCLRNLEFIGHSRQGLFGNCVLCFCSRLLCLSLFHLSLGRLNFLRSLGFCRSSSCELFFQLGHLVLPFLCQLLCNHVVELAPSAGCLADCCEHRGSEGYIQTKLVKEGLHNIILLLHLVLLARFALKQEFELGLVSVLVLLLLILHRHQYAVSFSLLDLRVPINLKLLLHNVVGCLQ